jgi:hypothetical protein
MFKLACETRHEAVLRSLAGNSDLMVRRAVAINPATPIEVLVKLWQDPEVRDLVESNPLWSVDPKDFGLLGLGAYLQGLPANVVLQLIKHVDPAVRRAVAQAGLGDVTDWLGEQDATIVAEYAKSILQSEPEPNSVKEVEEALKSYVGKVPEGIDRDQPALFFRPSFSENKVQNETRAQVPDGQVIKKEFRFPSTSKNYPEKGEELEVKIVGVVAPEGIQLAGSLDDLWARDPANPLNRLIKYTES